MKKILVAALIAVLVLGRAFVTMAKVSPNAVNINVNSEDNHGYEDGNNAIGDEESEENQEEGSEQTEPESPEGETNTEGEGANDDNEQEGDENNNDQNDPEQDEKSEDGDENDEASEQNEEAGGDENDGESTDGVNGEEDVSNDHEDDEEPQSEEENLDADNGESDNDEEDNESEDQTASGEDGDEEKEDDEEESEDDRDGDEDEDSGDLDDEEEDEGEDNDEDEAEDAIEAIREAEEKIDEAYREIDQAIEEADSDAFAGVMELLDEANNTLYRAKSAYEEGRYGDAQHLAEKAEEQADRVADFVEEILEKIENTEHSNEEREEEEEDELSTEEDEDGDLHIISRDNVIEFKKEEPKIEFKYANNETEVEFEAKDFALIEFNSSGIIKSLEFNDVQWNVTYQTTVEEDNTIINVTYYANTTEYEIALVMHSYQRSVTQSSVSNDAVVVFDIDGGADEVKYDLIVKRWTWASNSSRLALIMKLEAGVEGNVTPEAPDVDEDHVAIKLDDIRIKVSWVKKAEIRWPNGTSEFADVIVSYKSMEIEIEQGQVGLELEVNFTYPHFGANRLIHDPSIGIEDDPLLFIFALINQELLLGTGITAVAITIAAIALRREKMSLPALFL